MKTVGFVLCVVSSLGGFAQETASTRPRGTLPVADQAQPFEEGDPIVVEVFRGEPAVEAGSSSEAARDWRFKLGEQTYGTGEQELARLAAEIHGTVRPTIDAESRESKRAFLVRADPEAPFACIATLLQHAVAAGAPRLFFAARRTSKDVDHVLAALGVPFPAPPLEAPRERRLVMRIGLSWSGGRTQIVHDGRRLESDKDLERVYYSDTKEVPVRIEADGQVPWQRVIDVINLARRTGKKHLELSSKGALSTGGAIGFGPGRIGPGQQVRDVLNASDARGRIGRRNRQAGQLQATEKVVMAGLDWLQRHQSPDGSWDADGFPNRCEAQGGAECTGRGAAVFDVGTTALALLAFLGAGYDSQRPSPYLDNVRNGLKFLKDVQDAHGCFGSRVDNRFTYGHAVATIAMCEAFESAKQLPWRKSAEQAVQFIVAAQNPGAGWRYGVAPGDNDASVTGWMLMALFAARGTGIPFPQESVVSGLGFLDSITDEQTHRTGYVKKGEAPVRPEGFTSKFPATESESLTALGICTNIFAGRGAKTGGAKLLVAKLPAWDEKRGSIDMYYWYWGSLAMFQLGGEGWERWNRALKTAAIDHQIKTGCAAGSWDPKDPWGDEGGRVYSTALMTMCLEVYYRYARRT